MAGARCLAARYSGSRIAVAGEPTDFRLIFAHKRCPVDVAGRPDIRPIPTSATPRRCDAGVAGELLAFRAQPLQHRNTAFTSVPTLNLGCLRAGDNPNCIAITPICRSTCGCCPAWTPPQSSRRWRSVSRDPPKHTVPPSP